MKLLRAAETQEAANGRNWNCDNDKCVEPHGQIRVYPLDAGRNLLLCRACFDHENQYQRSRGNTGVTWQCAKVYEDGGKQDARQLALDLWWFIENVTDDDPTRTERFFALRERVRALQGGTQ